MSDEEDHFEIQDFYSENIIFLSRRYPGKKVVVGEENCLLDEKLSTASLLTVNNKYGYVCSTSSGGNVLIFKTKLLHRQYNIDEDEKIQKIERVVIQDLNDIKTIKFDSIPSFIQFSTVESPILNIMQENKLQLFHLTNILQDDFEPIYTMESVSKVVWNLSASKFCVVTTKGKCEVYNVTVKRKQIQIEKSNFVHDEIAVSASWTPTGQLSIADETGGLIVHDEIDGEFMVAYTVEIMNESPLLTHQWLDEDLLGITTMYDGEVQPFIVELSDSNVSKIYDALDCAHDSDERRSYSHFSYLKDWKIILLSASDVGEPFIYGKDEGEWKIIKIEDEAKRVSFPQSNDESSYPLGMQIDLTDTQDITSSTLDEPLAPSPVVLFLTTDGVIYTYSLIDKAVKEKYLSIKEPEVLEMDKVELLKVTEEKVDIGLKESKGFDLTSKESEKTVKFGDSEKTDFSFGGNFGESFSGTNSFGGGNDKPVSFDEKVSFTFGSEKKDNMKPTEDATVTPFSFKAESSNYFGTETTHESVEISFEQSDSGDIDYTFGVPEETTKKPFATIEEPTEKTTEKTFVSKPSGFGFGESSGFGFTSPKKEESKTPLEIDESSKYKPGLFDGWRTPTPTSSPSLKEKTEKIENPFLKKPSSSDSQSTFKLDKEESKPFGGTSFGFEDSTFGQKTEETKTEKPFDFSGKSDSFTKPETSEFTGFGSEKKVEKKSDFGSFDKKEEKPNIDEKPKDTKTTFGEDSTFSFGKTEINDSFTKPTTSFTSFDEKTEKKHDFESFTIKSEKEEKLAELDFGNQKTISKKDSISKEKPSVREKPKSKSKVEEEYIPFEKEDPRTYVEVKRNLSHEMKSTKELLERRRTERSIDKSTIDKVELPAEMKKQIEQFSKRLQESVNSMYETMNLMEGIETGTRKDYFSVSEVRHLTSLTKKHISIHNGRLEKEDKNKNEFQNLQNLYTEGFGKLMEIESLVETVDDENYRELVSQQPLDEITEKKYNEIKEKSSLCETQLEDIEAQLESLSLHHRKKSKKKSMPTYQIIQSTILQQNSSAISHLNTLNYLEKQLKKKKTRSYQYPSVKKYTTNLNTSNGKLNLSSISNALPNISPIAKRSMIDSYQDDSFFDETQSKKEKLKQALMNRKNTVVKFKKVTSKPSKFLEENIYEKYASKKTELISPRFNETSEFNSSYLSKASNESFDVKKPFEPKSLFGKTSDSKMEVKPKKETSDTLFGKKKDTESIIKKTEPTKEVKSFSFGDVKSETKPTESKPPKKETSTTDTLFGTKDSESFSISSKTDTKKEGFSFGGEIKSSTAKKDLKTSTFSFGKEEEEKSVKKSETKPKIIFEDEKPKSILKTPPISDSGSTTSEKPRVPLKERFKNKPNLDFKKVDAPSTTEDIDLFSQTPKSTKSAFTMDNSSVRHPFEDTSSQSATLPTETFSFSSKSSKSPFSFSSEKSSDSEEKKEIFSKEEKKDDKKESGLSFSMSTKSDDKKKDSELVSKPSSIFDQKKEEKKEEKKESKLDFTSSFNMSKSDDKKQDKGSSFGFGDFTSSLQSSSTFGLQDEKKEEKKEKKAESTFEFGDFGGFGTKKEKEKKPDFSSPSFTAGKTDTFGSSSSGLFGNVMDSNKEEKKIDFTSSFTSDSNKTDSSNAFTSTANWGGNDQQDTSSTGFLTNQDNNTSAFSASTAFGNQSSGGGITFGSQTTTLSSTHDNTSTISGGFGLFQTESSGGGFGATQTSSGAFEGFKSQDNGGSTGGFGSFAQETPSTFGGFGQSNETSTFGSQQSTFGDSANTFGSQQTNFGTNTSFGSNTGGFQPSSSSFSQMRK
eukprot:gene2519-3225_t